MNHLKPLTDYSDLISPSVVEVAQKLIDDFSAADLLPSYESGNGKLPAPEKPRSRSNGQFLLPVMT